MKLTEDELLRLACIYAEQDRRQLVTAYGGKGPAAKKAKLLADQLQKYRLKRWGKTQLESLMAKAKEVSVRDVIKLLAEEDK